MENQLNLFDSVHLIPLQGLFQGLSTSTLM